MAMAGAKRNKPPRHMPTPAPLRPRRPHQLLLLGALLASLLLTGCGLSPRQQQEAHRTAHQVRDHELTCPEQRADRCAMVSPVWELAGSPPAELALLEDPHVALLARIHAIRAAQRSIELQTYIFVPDASGKLVLSELLAAARRGVRVRLLMDQLAAFNDADFLAAMATAHRNLEIKVYNPIFDKSDSSALALAGGLLCCLDEINHRMHNKLLVVDGRIGITGGRNYRNHYWGWDPEFNFVDRDVLVLGETAGEMRASFDRFWAHEQAVYAEALLDVAARLLSGEVEPPDLRLDNHPESMRIAVAAGNPAIIRKRLVAALHEVERVAFYADRPGKPSTDDKGFDQDVTEVLRTLLAEAEQSVVMQTPYLVLSRPALKTFAKLRKRRPGIRLVVSTNSLASTDSLPVYAVARKRRKELIRDLGFHIYEFRPDPADRSTWIPPHIGRAATADRSARQGLPVASDEPLSIHAKSLVIDSRLAVIGSHNFDPRSEGYNTEVFLVVDDARFAQRLETQILRATLPENAWVVAAQDRIPVLSYFSGLIAAVSRRLPILDIWPFRYATCYELIPGRTPLPPDHPEFRDHYRDVGEFPQVALPLKQIQAELISAFGGFSEPFL
jgi:phosphatidylserine/phosphatidylglycerophosphate/cardiolipin synthase-like enzyme